MTKIHEIRPGVAVVIFDDAGRVLLQKRADVHVWGIPSGHVEPGETVLHAAVREVLEETGLHIAVTRLIGVYSEPESQVFRYPDGRVVHFVTLCFEGQIVGGELSSASPETLDVQFFVPGQLPKDMLPMLRSGCLTHWPVPRCRSFGDVSGARCLRRLVFHVYPGHKRRGSSFAQGVMRMKARSVPLAVLWVLTILLVVFSWLSWAGVVVRVPALVCLIVAACLTALRRYAGSPWWLAASLFGIAVVMVSIVPVATAKGTYAESHASAVNDTMP